MTLTQINIVNAKDELSELINRVLNKNERFILTRRGNDVAALVSMEDLGILLKSKSNHDLKESIDALQEARSVGTFDLDKLNEDIGKQ